tara:strand:- start:138 stop:707 length:570 start_codon:yes stop_codon:yes gene_type:complete
VVIGVLSLQGAFGLHQKILSSINVHSILVRDSLSLMNCDALIIPGGESTVLSKLIEKHNLDTAIKDFSDTRPVFGTCAGMILMSKDANDSKVSPLNLIDITVDRNAWGRQINSFNDNILIGDYDFDAIFIRAPKIKSLGSSVNVIAKYKNNPVLVSNGKHMAASFHPELTNNPLIHNLFIENILSYGIA